MSRITLLCLGLAVVATSLWSPEAEAAPPVQYTSRTRFRIPYRFDPAQMQRIGAQEIRLFLSRDRGSRWLTAQTVPPRAGRFDFQATEDGEYWFAVRTVDARNQLHPRNPVAGPELQVIVDTTRPELKLQLSEVQPGRVGLAWQLADQNLDPATLQLEYRDGRSDRWQQVVISPKPSGHTSWTLAAGGLVQVRGSVQDLAGNSGSAEDSLTVRPAGGTRPRPSVPDFSQPIASAPGQANGAPDPRGRATSQNQFISNSGSGTPEIVQPRYPSTGQQSFDQPGGTGQMPTQQEMTTGNAPPQGRLVKSRQFQIGYTLDDVGPSGVSSVELYITQNNGEKWYLYGTDDDRNSPFPVTVHQDGVYGFSLRVRSGVGLAATPPNPGERPAIVIVVDQTAPSVQLLPPRQGTGANHNRVLISWQVTDRHLIERPVSLSYAADPSGPWEPITGWIANSGSHEWSIGPGLPRRMYIRLTARDAAGNIARAEATQPILVDLSRPTARILDVEPAGIDP